MKIATVIVLILAIIFSLLYCNNDTIIQPEKSSNAKIKRKLFYNYIEDKIPLKIYEYFYNCEMRLEKIYHYKGNNSSEAYEYELYRYNTDNKIVNKFTYSYAGDSVGWTLYDCTFYSYSNGRLINEETYYFTVSLDHIFYKYEYENSHLTRKFEFYNQQLANYTVYNYSGDLCVRETMFSDSLGLGMTEYMIHHYERGVLLKSEKFSGNDIKIQIINYTYNGEGNLVIEEAKQTDLTVVKPLYYVVRYEYY